MNADTEITLDEVHGAIVAAISAQFPSLETVEFYSQDRARIRTPACLLELASVEVDPDIDPGTGQLAVMADFEARFLISFKQPGLNPKLEIRRLALAFAAFARSNRWGVPVGPAEVIGAFPDDFDPELDQYEVWRVEWRQAIHLGESVWNVEGVTPSTVMLGQVPLVGAGHADDYAQVVPQ